MKCPHYIDSEVVGRLLVRVQQSFVVVFLPPLEVGGCFSPFGHVQFF